MQAAPTPTQFGPYVVTGTLGQGGMGVVYRARDPKADGFVAIKAPRYVDAAVVARTRAEMHALSRIHHPAIVRYLAGGSREGLPWYAMELLEGRTLRGLIAELWASPGVDVSTLAPASGSGGGATWVDSMEGDAMAPLPAVGPLDHGGRPPAANGRLTEVLTLFRRLCPPLSLLHAQGIVHRDLKPENVFLRPSGAPVLMDLGLISLSRGGLGREKLEVGGLMAGTLSYMAPEQSYGLLVDARADLYALGAMLYEAVTGRLPITGGALQEMLTRIRTVTPPPASHLVEGVPAALDELLMALLAKDVRRRIGHADDVDAVLGEIGAEPVPEGERVHSRPYLYRPSLCGRAERRAQLSQLVEDVGRGKGALVFIGGESGVGKTFLATDAARMAGHRRVPVITGECLPLTPGVTELSVMDATSAPLHPFKRFLLAVADRCREQPDSAPTLLGERARLLAPFEPALAETPGYAQLPVPPLLPPALARRRTIDALLDTVRAYVGAQGSLLLLLDDLQWADDLTYDCLRRMDAEWLGRAALLVVATWRNDEATPALRELVKAPHAVRMDLTRLDEAAVGEVVGEMLAMPDPPRPFVDFVYRQTAGNPFFVAEYLRLSVAEGLLERHRGRWAFRDQANALERLPVPRSLRELITRRQADLPPLARRALAYAAVRGRHVTLAGLRRALGDEDLALDAVRELIARQVLEQDDTDAYSFVHDKLREAALSDIPDAELPDLHRLAAETIEQELAGATAEGSEFGALARHWLGAGVVPKAIDAWVQQGRRALANFSNREAIDSYEAALDLLPRAPEAAGPLDVGGWHRALTCAYLDIGQREPAARHASLALETLGHPFPTSNAALGLGVLRLVAVNILQGLMPGLFAVKDPRRQLATLDAAMVYQRQLEPFFLEGKPLPGTYSGMSTVVLAARIPPSAVLARGYAFMSMVVGMTPLKSVARRWAARSLEIAENESGDTRVYVRARSSLFNIAHAEWGEAEKKMAEALPLARAIGDLRQAEEVRSIFVQVLLWMGRLEEALDMARSMCADAERRGDPQTQEWAQNLATCALTHLGRGQEAAAMFARSAPFLDGLGQAETVYSCGNGAAACLLAGDLAGARRFADRARDAARASDPVVYFHFWGLSALCETYIALAARAAGADAELRASAKEALGWLVAFQRIHPFGRAMVPRVRGELALLEGRVSAAARDFAAAVEEAGRLHMPAEEAKARVLLARHGPPDERRRHAALALALAEHMGAAALVSEARAVIASLPPA